MKILKLRKERIHNTWTQSFVAKHIALTVTAVHDIETGKRKPSFNVLVKLEDLFGMDYRELFNLPQLQLRGNNNKPDGNQAEKRN